MSNEILKVQCSHCGEISEYELPSTQMIVNRDNFTDDKKLTPVFDRKVGVSKCSNCEGIVYSHFKWCPFCRCELDWDNYMADLKEQE